jgi:DNA-binding GntR family transcriptional regulator
MPLDPVHTWQAVVKELDQAKAERPGSVNLANTCARVLRDTLRSGSLTAGERLPSEDDLALILRVSRATVREALRTLEAEGLIARRHGIGTVVLAEPIRKDLSLNFGITAMIQNAGFKEQIEELEVREEVPPQSICDALGICHRHTVLTLDRVRAVDGRRIVWSVDYLPCDVQVADSLKVFASSEQGGTSIYDFLSVKLDISVVRGLAHLRAISAGARIAEKLCIKRGGAIMEMTQTDYDRAGSPVLYSQEWHVPDAVEFLIERSGPFK